MRRPTWLEILDICLVIVGMIIIVSIALGNNSEIVLNETSLPTAINGMTTVTGIIVASTSGLIAFTMSLHVQHSFPLRKYREHSILSLIIVLFSLLLLVFAYGAVLTNHLAEGAKMASLALLMSILNLFEFLVFFEQRILEDLVRGQQREL